MVRLSRIFARRDSPAKPGPRDSRRPLLIALTVVFWTVSSLSLPGAEPRVIRAKDAFIQPGKSGKVSIELDAKGGEAAVAFSLRFDTNLLQFEHVAAGTGAAGALLLSNSKQTNSGIVGIGMAKAPGQAFPAGSTELVELTFRALAEGETAVRFSDNPITRQLVDLEVNNVPVQFVDGKVQIPGLFVATGKVTYYENGKPVSGAMVQRSGLGQLSVTTDPDGSFSTPVEAGQNYSLSVAKGLDHPPNRGVTTLDISLVRRQILGLAPLPSPYKILAADVNGSASVTTLDIILMRRLILGLADSYPGGTLWRFVPSNQSFSDPRVPWNAAVSRDLTETNSNWVDQDFYGIKLGDVNATWTPPVEAAAAAQQLERNSPALETGVPRD